MLVRTAMSPCATTSRSATSSGRFPYPGLSWVLSAHPADELVLYSTASLPAWLRDRWWLDRTWAIRLDPIVGGSSIRLRLRVRAAGSMPLRLAWHLLIAPRDYLMTRGLLRRIRTAVENQVRVGDEDGGPDVPHVAAVA